MERDPLIVLDTHAWIWWTSSPERLSDAARQRCEGADSLGVCAISCWEVAMLVAKGRLTLDRDVLTWVQQALRQPRIRLLPLLPEIAVAATRFGEGIPPDPADRIVLASALHHGAPLVTKDRALWSSQGAAIVW